MARVIWRKPDGSVEDRSIAESTTLGRDDDVDFTVHGRGVSRRHARIELRESYFVLCDLGSTNGTLLNGKKLQGDTVLHTGDRIQIGTQSIEFDGETGAVETRSAFNTEPLSRTLDRETASTGQPPARIRRLPESLPRNVGKFRLDEKIGQGGMGAVYRAVDLDSQRDVAVKFIRQNIGRKEAFLEYFHHREAVLAREIDHPNVIQIYEHGVEEDQHYISMQFVRGESLYQVMKRRTLETSEVLETLRQVACGLSAAHRQGVVHSDIKPANILIEGQNGSNTVETRTEADSSGEDVGDVSILEFDTGGPIVPASDPSPNAKDPGLLEEIRRRVGERENPSEDVLDDPPYFERPSEMRFLEHYIERMKEKRGFFLLVEGEAGTGKDRLISEFLLRQRALRDALPDPSKGVRFLELDCSRIEGIPRLYEQFQPRVALTKLKTQEMVEGLQNRFQENDHPTVIRILDFGKAVPLVCRLLAYVSTLMDKKPITLIASLEPGDVRPNDSAKVLTQSLRAMLKELYLRPLTEYQIRRYVHSLFPDCLAEDKLSADLYRLSDGNFSRVLDLLRSFFERGALRADSTSGWVQYRPNFRELQLEEGKNLYEKYRSYGKLEQRTLESAAFIGPRFFFDTLQKLVGVDETSLFFILRKLLAEGFFTEESRTWYRFTNLTFQRYMAERIPPPDRPHLHRKLSRMLQTVPVPESAELFQLRALHFAGCREYAKAVQCYLEGAHLARNEYQTDLEREFYQEILTIYRELGRREGPRKEVVAVLREWFRRDGNWYEILGEMGAGEAVANVKIADFGISFRMSDEERGYRVGKRPALGTPRYLSPERGKGEPGGTKSDIFSLGIIAYEMVVGEPAFPGLKGSELVRAYREKTVRIPPKALERFPDGFERVIQGMIEIDSARRWDAERVIREVVKLQFDLKLRRSGGDV
jgi:serine/threonine protein kinase